MTFANLTDVSSRLGRTISDRAEISQVNTWLGDVETIIRARIPGLDAAVTAGSPAEDTVVMVEASAVVRKIKNPDGKKYESIDDYRYGLTDDASKGDLFLTDAEWDLLSPANGPEGAFTIIPGGLRPSLAWDSPTSWTVV